MHLGDSIEHPIDEIIGIDDVEIFHVKLLYERSCHEVTEDFAPM